MVPPPFYADIGKNARDVLNKGYHFNLLKLDVKTKTVTGVEFEFGGVQNLENKNVFGSLETKYKFKEYGVAFAEKWNTDNELSIETSFSDFCEGVKMAVEMSMIPRVTPPSGNAAPSDEKGYSEKRFKLKADFKNPILAVNLESEFKIGGPIVNAALVLGYGGWLFGGGAKVLAGHDNSVKLLENKFSMGFVTRDFILSTSVTNGEMLSGSVYHKLNDNLEMAVIIAWSVETNACDFGLGCQYQLAGDTNLRFKVNHNAEFGIGYCHKLKEGLTICLSGMIGAKTLREGGSKLGFSLELGG